MISRKRLLAAALSTAALACCALASTATAAAPAWMPVAASGPTNVPVTQSEVQRLYVNAESGTYKLQVTTGTATVTTVTNSPTMTITAAGYGSFQVGDLVSLTSTVAAGTTILSCSPSCAAPTTLTLSNPVTAGAGANKTLSAEELATNIAANAPANGAGSLEAALTALPGIGASGVSVSGGPGGPGAKDPYTIAFGGPLANADVAQVVPTSTGLAGGEASVAVSTIVPGGAGTSTLALYVQNIGGVASSGTVTYKAVLPAGLVLTAKPSGGSLTKGLWTCGGNAGESEFTCTYTGTLTGEGVQPGTAAPDIKAIVKATGGPGTGTLHTEVSGAGGGPKTFDMPLTVSAIPAPPGIQSFVAGAFTSNGVQDTRAGSHPFSASTGIFANTLRSVKGVVVPSGEFRDISVDLPPGFLGNPIAVPQCPESTASKECPSENYVGTVEPILGFGEDSALTFPVSNTEAPYGNPAKFRFDIVVEPLNAVGSLRSDSDYGITVASLNTPQIATVDGTFFTFWGSPAEAAHDPVRKGPATFPNVAFLTNATNCAEQAISPPVTYLNTTLWQNPGEVFTGSVDINPVTNCNNLHFEDNFTFEPSNTKSDSTASFRTSLTVPSEGLTDPTKFTTPELKDMVVQLPKGVVLNASGADGLQGCSESQIGLLNEIDPQTGLPIPKAMPNPIRFDKNAQTCPEASKIGTGELKSALLEEPLHGALYLAAQGKGNPFGSLFAVYLVIEDPRHGIFIKLPGEVEANKQTGQLEVIFQDLPQLPFTRLDLNLKGGDRSALASPTTCGTYTTTAMGTPWSYPESGPPTETGQSFDINEGPNGGACAKTPQERPFNLGWEAGDESTKAGESGPFNFRITRPDGSQEIENLELQTPQGVSASLKGIPYCTEAEIKQAESSTGKEEQEHPACPAASKVGTLTTGAGSGPSPFYVSGNLYLAGPYKGAPISVVAITPAVAGPFDLGNVVVRGAVFINRETAQVSAKSDPIPQFLDGVQLRIKDVRIHLDRSDWTINPTSCEASSVKLTAHGNSGATAERSARFQVGNCGSLGFKPKLTGKVTGPTKRGGLPAFTATLTYPEGHYANLKDVQVALPHSEFLEQAHINTVCTRVQAAAHECPAGSIYGYAEAFTPLLDKPLTGPVFLKSSVHKLPDLAIALKGPEDQPVEVEFAGRIDSIHGQIRDTIEGLPDVPVSKFILRMKGGKKGLLVNSRNICNGAQTKMTVHMTAQNNAVSDTRPPLGNSCGAKKHKAKKSHRAHKRSQRRVLVGDLFRAW